MLDATPNDLFMQLKQLLTADTRSESAIARLAGVSQPSVSRYRHGAVRHRWSGSFIKLCSFYGLDVQEHGRRRRAQYEGLLRDAIIDLWDGSDNQADALLELLQSLKQLTLNTPPGARNG
jgi:hypothetical protein